MIRAKGLAVGAGKSFSVYVDRGDFEKDCSIRVSQAYPPEIMHSKRVKSEIEYQWCYLIIFIIILNTRFS